MIEFSEFWLAELIRATLVLSLAVLLANCIFRFTQAKPQTRVLSWMLVLVPCWLMFSFALEIPWLDSSSESGVTSAVVWSLPNQSINSTPAPTIESATNELRESKLQITGWIAISLLGAWASGIIFLVSKYLRSYLRMQRSLRRVAMQSDSKHSLPVAWINEFDKAKHEIGLRQDIQFLVSDDLGPLLCWFRGQNYVIVPKAFWESSTPQQRSAILLHELAHAKRFDVWWMLLARILILPQWFNPLAWYALRQLSESVEMACDDEVLKHSEFGQFEYAKSLVSLVEFKQSEVSFGLPAIGPPVQQRIQRIIHPNGVEMKFTRMIAIGSLVLISSFGLVRPELVAQNSNSKTDSGPAEESSPSVNSTVSNPDDGESLTPVTYDVSEFLLFPVHLPGSFQLEKPKNQLGGITLDDFLPIVDLIKSTIESESWGENGKSISPYVQNLTLVIIQTPETHAKVQSLLAKLRGINRFTIELESFIVLAPEGSNLLPAELGKNGKIIESKVIQTIRDAAKNEVINLMSIPETEMFIGQTVVYQGLNRDLWSVEGLSASAMIDRDMTSIRIKLAGITSWPFKFSRDNLLSKMVDGRVVKYQSGTIEGPIRHGVDFEEESLQRDRVEKSIGVVSVGDGEYLALDVSSMLNADRQDRRAILIVNAKIKDNQKPGGDN